MGATTGWKEKHDEATKLVAEVKAAHPEVKDSAGAEELERKMADAIRLGAEAKAEKAEETNARIATLLEAYEKQGASTTKAAPEGNGSGMVVVDPEAKRQESQTKAEDYFAGGRIRLIATEQAVRKMGVKSFSYETQTSDPDALKVLNEGTTTAGGFLVPPQYLQELFAETRRQGNALRRLGWLTEYTTTSSQVLLPKGGGAATFAIVAENATKPTADQTYSQVTINIFTAAGISKVSNQLIADADPMVADLVGRELGSLAGNLEEQKIISGTGTGEPRGILATTGIGSVVYTDATPTAQELIDAIIDAIANVQQNYFAAPTGILMHPRRLAFLQKGKDTATNYLFNPAGTFRAPGGLGGTVGANSVTTGGVAVQPTLLGLPVGISTNIPTNLGAGTNEDRVIVANWNEALWFQRQDLTLDASNQASTAFEANQTWFRLEERFGFSAERYPTAFCVVSGTGLVP